MRVPLGGTRGREGVLPREAGDGEIPVQRPRNSVPREGEPLPAKLHFPNCRCPGSHKGHFAASLAAGERCPPLPAPRARCRSPPPFPACRLGGLTLAAWHSPRLQPSVAILAHRSPAPPGPWSGSLKEPGTDPAPRLARRCPRRVTRIAEHQPGQGWTSPAPRPSPHRAGGKGRVPVSSPASAAHSAQSSTGSAIFHL